MNAVQHTIGLILILNALLSTIQTRGTNGGISCAACTIVMGLIQQLAQLYNATVINGTKIFCQHLPRRARGACLMFANRIEPLLINQEIDNFITADVICYAIKSCTKDKNRGYCHLFPRPWANFRHTVEKFEKIANNYNARMENFCDLPAIKDVCQVFMNSLSTLDPVQDNDKDKFSVINYARGSHWRGKDCRDWDNNTYPGRKPFNNDIEFDSNCNGIWGVDPSTGKTWEEILCENSEPRGIVYIGDSIGAHFHFPEQWINPLKFDETNIENITNEVLDELDWPQYGFATGFKNSTEPQFIAGITDSIYLRLRERNRCNHRDYQDLSQNGASSFNVSIHASNLTRSQNRDKPCLVFYALLGNDICNRFQDTIEYMTSPEQFGNNVLSVLDNLDTKLPHGSHVVLVGLIDGSEIYPSMANLIHPLGSVHKNIRYKDMYEWFTCMEIGPCVGWMTPNATLRQIATQKSQDLTSILIEIVAKTKFKHFTLHFIRNPVNLVLEKYGHFSNFIDQVDSLHPNQKSQPLLATEMWNELLKLPNVLGPINPLNQKIDEIFGDQGGH